MSWLLITSCSPSYTGTVTQPTDQSMETGNIIVPGQGEQSPLSWDILFRKVPGVQVLGTYPNMRINIRGSVSLRLTTEPLFILDNIVLGNSFRDLANTTTPAEVDYIRVLKGPDAAMYGSRGANGVVIVKQKNQIRKYNKGQ